MFYCLGADWRPTIGDPTVYGWLTVLAYLTCAILAVLVWNSRPEPVLRRFWGFAALLLAALAFNKQMDLQTALTSTGRCLFRMWGLYDQRSFAQLLFVIIFAAVVFLLYLRVMRAMRRYLQANWMAMLGLGLVVLYVLIRATSFHMIDLVGGQQVAGVPVNFLFENAGLVLIAANAIGLLAGLITVRRRPGRRDPRQPVMMTAVEGRRPFTAGAPQPREGGAANGAPPVATVSGPRFPVEPLNR